MYNIDVTYKKEEPAFKPIVITAVIKIHDYESLNRLKYETEEGVLRDLAIKDYVLSAEMRSLLEYLAEIIKTL